MTNYTKWLVRSRAILFTGAAFLLVPSFAAFRPAALPLGLDGETTKTLIILGICMIIVGMLDSFGLIQRKWVKAAIREENERMRSGG